MLILILIFLFFLAIFLQYTMAFQGTTHAIGRLVVGASKGHGVQDSITPRSQTIRNLIMLFLVAILFVITTFAYKWYYGILAVAVLPIVGPVLGWVFGIRTGSHKMVMVVIRAMEKRYDSYKQQGDKLRAKLALELIESMKVMSLDEIQKEAWKK